MVESADGIGEFLEDLKKNTFQKYDAFTVAEVLNMKEGELAEFIGEDGHFSTIFDFSAILSVTESTAGMMHHVLTSRNGGKLLLIPSLRYRNADLKQTLLRITTSLVVCPASCRNMPGLLQGLKCLEP